MLNKKENLKKAIQKTPITYQGITFNSELSSLWQQ